MGSLMPFSLFAFRFTFETLDSVSFSPGAAGNAFRGAFGHIFRRIACHPACVSAKTCDVRAQCAYAHLFEPVCLDGPSGLADAPRPFVIRAASLDGQSFRPGSQFSIDVHIFDLHEPAVAYFILAFHELARTGIGAGRGRVELVHVSALDGARRVGTLLYEGGRFLRQESSDRIDLSMKPWDPDATHEVTLRFVTPTELKTHGEILKDAPFSVVVARARDRIATLSQLYGRRPMDMDFRGISERASHIQTVSSSLRSEFFARHSSRTHQSHPLGGFVGEATYVGQLGEFLPFLNAAYWTGIGRQTVWGKGLIEIARQLPPKEAQVSPE
jgi:hypothetical protein